MPVIRRLRTRLVLLGLLVALPIAIERGLDIMDEVNSSSQHLRDHAQLELDKAINFRHHRVELLQAFLAPFVIDFDPRFQGCSDVLTRAIRRQNVITSAAVADEAGRIICSSQAHGVGLNIGDRPYFQNAMQHGFAVSDIIVGRISKEARLFGARRISNDEGKTKHILVASINLEDLSREIKLGASTTHIAVVNQNGDTIAEHIVGIREVRSYDWPSNLLEAVKSGQKAVYLENGYAFATASYGPSSSVVLMSDAHIAINNLNMEIMVAFFVTILVSAGASLLSWSLADSYFIQPLRLLTAATKSEDGLIGQFKSNAPQHVEMARLGSALTTAIDRLESEAFRDGLTGLANRRRFDRALETTATQSNLHQTTALLLLIDIDHFKKLNDRYGHPRGDKVLCMVAKALDEFGCGPDGLACRYGGEEFALLFKELSHSDAQMVADSLIDVIAALRIEHIDSLTGYVTISVGCAAFRSDEDTATWLRRCDEALYRAKRGGRNQAVIDDPDSDFASITPLRSNAA